MREKQDPWHGLRIQVRQRLATAVAHLRETGSLRRADLVRFGEVSVPQASADINLIKERMPGLMEYDLSAKCYRLTRCRAKAHKVNPADGGPEAGRVCE